MHGRLREGSFRSAFFSFDVRPCSPDLVDVSFHHHPVYAIAHAKCVERLIWFPLVHLTHPARCKPCPVTQIGLHVPVCPFSFCLCTHNLDSLAFDLRFNRVFFRCGLTLVFFFLLLFLTLYVRFFFLGLPAFLFGLVK